MGSAQKMGDNSWPNVSLPNGKTKEIGPGLIYTAGPNIALKVAKTVSPGDYSTAEGLFKASAAGVATGVSIGSTVGGLVGGTTGAMAGSAVGGALGGGVGAGVYAI